MLTDTAIRQLKPAASLYRRSDRHGLCIEVTPQGVKHWRFRYRWAGKAKMISLGTYPFVTLAQARDRSFEARRLLANGQNPVEAKRDQAKKITEEENAKFPVIARAWLEDRKDEVSAKTYAKMKTVLEGDLIPALKNASVATLGSPEAVAILKKIEARAPHMAVKAKGCLTQIIERAIQTGLREDGKNLTLRRAIRTPKTVSVPAAVTDNSLQKVLRAVDAYEGEVVRAALKLASLTAMRPANIVEARWEHIDLARRTWTIPAEQMKSGKEHMVPLSRQAMAILEQAKKWGRHGGWVFPAVAKQDTPHLHRDALSKALRSMGMQGKHVPHGFRSSFRTIMREEFGIAEDILEAQIAHAKKGAVNKAYDRTRFLKQRVPVMQQWADHLDSLLK